MEFTADRTTAEMSAVAAVSVFHVLFACMFMPTQRTRTRHIATVVCTQIANEHQKMKN